MLRKQRLRPVPVTVGAMEAAIEENLQQSMPCRDLYELLKDRHTTGTQSDLKFMSSIRIHAHLMSWNHIATSHVMPWNQIVNQNLRI